MTEKGSDKQFFNHLSFRLSPPETGTSGDSIKHCPPVEHLKPFMYSRFLKGIESAKSANAKYLINKINYLNFIDGKIWLHLKHKSFEDHFLISVSPEPCQDDRLICRMSDTCRSALESHAFLTLLVPSDDTVIISPAVPESIGNEYIAFCIPDTNYVINDRQTCRYRCPDLNAQITQNAFSATGKLIDFSPFGLRIEFDYERVSSPNWFNHEALVTLAIQRKEVTILSTACRCIRASHDQGTWVMVLVPASENLHQFQKTKIRNPRWQLKPSFELSLNHPLTGKIIQRSIYDISTSGFSVLEESGNGSLLPGLILADVTIIYAGALEIKCRSAQVLYRQIREDGKTRCGIAILDMDISDYSDLNSIIASNIDPNVHISDKVDLDELWYFFFETGFIYPEKYKHIHDIKQTFKTTYHKLYAENPEIARHVTYKFNGRIYGHVSMVRAYEKTWMFHHLSARSLNNHLIGFNVLKHLNHFMNELCRFPSSKIDYLICFYRPQNRFSKLIFGEFAKSLNNPRAASLDVFSYLVYPKIEKLRNELPQGWTLNEFSKEDLWQLKQFYKHHSGGLLLEGLHLGQHHTDGEQLETVYERLGFTRKIKIYSLFQSDILKAVMIVDQTDFGFNLSNLLNGIKILICDPNRLAWSVLSTAIDKLVRAYDNEEVPILTYPASYIHEKKLNFEQKEYVLITLDARFYNEFILYAKKKFKLTHWE